MTVHKRRVWWLTLAVACAAALISGVALAVGSDEAPPADVVHVDRQPVGQDVHQATDAVVAAFATFAATSAGNTVSIEQQSVLRNQLGGGTADERGPIANADFSMARSAPIQGSAAEAYVVPSGDQVCLVVPDPGDGFGATCQTVDAIKAGRGVLTLTPRPETGDTFALAAAIVPDGGRAPTLETPRGTKSLEVHDNIAATVATTADKLQTTAGTISLAR